MLPVHVSDADAAGDLRRHLARQGFPAATSSPFELAVLFPGEPGMFAPAVELDLWQMNHTAVTVTALGEVKAR